MAVVPCTRDEDENEELEEPGVRKDLEEPGTLVKEPDRTMLWLQLILGPLPGSTCLKAEFKAMLKRNWTEWPVLNLLCKK